MASFIIKNTQILLGAYDISGVMNNVTLGYDNDVQDATTLADSAKAKLSGLTSFNLSTEGFWDKDIDAAAFAKIGAADEVVTLFPDTSAFGDTAYFGQVLHTSHTLGGAIGEVFPFTLETTGDNRLIRGVQLFSGTDTASGNGSGFNNGAVASGESIYASLHVIAASGTTPTLDVTVTSDDDGTWPTGSATELTFAQATGVGAEFVSAPGPITNGYYRVDYTIGGTSPSFQFIIAFGTSTL